MITPKAHTSTHTQTHSLTHTHIHTHTHLQAPTHEHIHLINANLHIPRRYTYTLVMRDRVEASSFSEEDIAASSSIYDTLKVEKMKIEFYEVNQNLT